MIMTRSLAALGLLLGVAAWGAAQDTTPEPVTPSPGAEPGSLVANLSEQLTAGLLVREDDEKAFVALVAQRVADGALPLKVVNIAYRYGRSRHKKYPFIYFRQALLRLADKLNIDLDP